MFNAIAYADSLDELLFKVNDKILNPLIEFSFIIALVIFLYGVMQFIRGANNKDMRAKGQQHIMWGLVGFLIMFGVFTIINLLTKTLGISGVRINNKEQTFTPPPIKELKLPK
jgi:hypothetical protein